LNFIHTIFILCDTEEKAYYILFLQYNLSVAIIIILPRSPGLYTGLSVCINSDVALLVTLTLRAVLRKDIPPDPDTCIL
jgi:hypothetical protein